MFDGSWQHRVDGCTLCRILAHCKSFSFQAYFEDNPSRVEGLSTLKPWKVSRFFQPSNLESFKVGSLKSFQALQHDKPLHAAKIQPELKNMPDYLGMYIDASFGGWACQCPFIWWVVTSVADKFSSHSLGSTNYVSQFLTWLIKLTFENGSDAKG